MKNSSSNYDGGQDSDGDGGGQRHSAGQPPSLSPMAARAATMSTRPTRGEHGSGDEDDPTPLARSATASGAPTPTEGTVTGLSAGGGGGVFRGIGGRAAATAPLGVGDDAGWRLERIGDEDEACVPPAQAQATGAYASTMEPAITLQDDNSAVPFEETFEGSFAASAESGEGKTECVADDGAPAPQAELAAAYEEADRTSIGTGLNTTMHCSPGPSGATHSQQTATEKIVLPSSEGTQGQTSYTSPDESSTSHGHQQPTIAVVDTPDSRHTVESKPDGSLLQEVQQLTAVGSSSNPPAASASSSPDSAPMQVENYPYDGLHNDAPVPPAQTAAQIAEARKAIDDVMKSIKEAPSEEPPQTTNLFALLRAEVDDKAKKGKVTTQPASSVPSAASQGDNLGPQLRHPPIETTASFSHTSMSPLEVRPFTEATVETPHTSADGRGNHRGTSASSSEVQQVSTIPPDPPSRNTDIEQGQVPSAEVTRASVGSVSAPSPTLEATLVDTVLYEATLVSSSVVPNDPIDPSTTTQNEDGPLSWRGRHQKVIIAALVLMIGVLAGIVGTLLASLNGGGATDAPESGGVTTSQNGGEATDAPESGGVTTTSPSSSTSTGSNDQSVSNSTSYPSLAPSPKYHLNIDLKGPMCPDGHEVVSVDECVVAASDIGLEYDYIQADDWTHTPCGCFLMTDQGSVYLNYDRGEIGECNEHEGVVGMVCKGPSLVPSPKYHLTIDLKGPVCPDGHEVVSSGECVAAAREIGLEYDYIQTDDWTHTPCGCFLMTFKGSVYLNYDKGEIGECNEHERVVGMVCKGPSPIPSREYQLRKELKGPMCPDGLDVVSETECVAAASHVGLKYDEFQAGDWDYTPCGCFLYHSKDGTVFVDYDRGLIGECKRHSQVAGMLCKGSPQYQLRRDLDGPTCPVGLEVVSEAQCIVAARQNDLQYNQFDAGNWDSTPCGCFLYSGEGGEKLVYHGQAIEGCQENPQVTGIVCIEALPEPSQPSTGSTCLLVTTNNLHDYSGGYVNVFVDSGSGYASVGAPDTVYYSRGEGVVDKCFDTIVGVQVSNQSTDAWTGSIALSMDSKTTYHSLLCVDCDGSRTMPIVVDGDANSADQATTRCFNGATCTLVPPPCLLVTTGSNISNEGHVDIFVDSDGSGYILVSTPNVKYLKGEVVIDQCFDKIVGVQVSNKNNDAWTGSISISMDGKVTYQHLICSNCGGETNNMPIVVGVGSNGSNQATTWCLGAATCTISLEYHLNIDLKGPICPNGHEVVSPGECAVAAREIGLEYDNMQTNDRTHTPCGCFLMTNQGSVFLNYDKGEVDECNEHEHVVGMVCKGPSPTPSREYQLRKELKGPMCPDGLDVVSETECVAAASHVGLKYDKFHAGDWDYTPCGCFLYHVKDGTVFVDYDRGSIGECKEHSQVAGMLCKGSPQYQLHRGLDGPTCPVGLEVVSEGQCKTAARQNDLQYDSYPVPTSRPSDADFFEGEFLNTDIGFVGCVGQSYETSPGLYVVQGSGADIWGTSDGFHYMYVETMGDATFTVLMERFEGSVNGWLKGGVMFRSSLDSSSSHYSLFTTTSNGLATQYRTCSGCTSLHFGTNAAFSSVWLRVSKVGDVMRSYYKSTLADYWTPYGVVSISEISSSGYYVGIGVTALSNAVLATIYISNIQLTSTCSDETITSLQCDQASNCGLGEASGQCYGLGLACGCFMYPGEDDAKLVYSRQAIGGCQENSQAIGIVCVEALPPPSQPSTGSSLPFLWMPIGDSNTITGDTAGDDFGHHLAISGDGVILAVAADKHNGNGVDSGHVKLYKLDAGSSTYEQMGEAIEGKAAGDRFGEYVALAADGKTLAIGGTQENTNSPGYVNIYAFDEDGLSWEKTSQTLIGEAAGDAFGHRVALSVDGNVLAISAPRGGGGQLGYVKVYMRRDEGTSGYEQTGQSIVERGIYVGSSLALSGDGTTVAIGTQWSSIGNDEYTGQAWVYRIDDTGNTWEQLGQDLIGDGAYNYFAWSLALSEDGNTLATSAPLGYAEKGHVRVYSLNEDGSELSWKQLGQDIVGVSREHLGEDVSISADGQVLATGAIFYDGNGVNSGRASVYRWDKAVLDYKQVGNSIVGDASGDMLGRVVALSSKGEILAVSAGVPVTDSPVSPGYVRVYKLENSTASF